MARRLKWTQRDAEKLVKRRERADLDAFLAPRYDALKRQAEAELDRPARIERDALAKLAPGDPQRRRSLDPRPGETLASAVERHQHKTASARRGAAASAKKKRGKYADAEVVRAVVAHVDRPGEMPPKLRLAAIRRELRRRRAAYPLDDFARWLKNISKQ